MDNWTEFQTSLCAGIVFVKILSPAAIVDRSKTRQLALPLGSFLVLSVNDLGPTVILPVQCPRLEPQNQELVA